MVRMNYIVTQVVIQDKLLNEEGDLKQMKMNEINRYYIKLIEDNFEQNRITHAKSVEYLKNSTARYHGETIYSLYAPKLFPENVIKYLDESVNTIYSILEKVIKEYINSEDYRKLFGFDKMLEELILIDRGYASYLPMARVDIFLNEEDLSFKFCEFNADGTSSMNEDRELNIALTKTDAYLKMIEKYELQTFELFDSWAEEFMKVYETYHKKISNPRIGIVDFLEKGSSIEEFNMFKKSFEKAGYEAEVCEIRELRYKDNVLYSASGKRIDAIYRRAVTSDIMDHIDEVSDFIQAVKEQNICLVGSFCTQVIHNKILYKLLFHERTLRFLNDQERQFIKEHVPYTVVLNETECDINEIINHKDKWIIKPEDSYGAKGVYAGVNFDASKWKSLIMENLDNHYLLQEFNMPYQSINIDFYKEKPEYKNYSNLTGLYVYNGKFKGIYSRQSVKEIISTQYDENVIASVMVKD